MTARAALLSALITFRQGGGKRADAHQFVKDVYVTPWITPQPACDDAEPLRAGADRKDTVSRFNFKKDFGPGSVTHHNVQTIGEDVVAGISREPLPLLNLMLDGDYVLIARQWFHPDEGLQWQDIERGWHVVADGDYLIAHHDGKVVERLLLPTDMSKVPVMASRDNEAPAGRLQ